MLQLQVIHEIMTCQAAQEKIHSSFGSALPLLLGFTIAASIERSEAHPTQRSSYQLSSVQLRCLLLLLHHFLLTNSDEHIQ